MPTAVSGADNIPPGTYDARLRVEYGMCIPCSTRFGKGGATQPDTHRGNNQTEESKGL
jgi:hypothetical protein